MHWAYCARGPWTGKQGHLLRYVLPEEAESCSKLHLEWRSGSLQRWGQLPTPWFGNTLPPPFPALVISLEVDTQLSEKEDEVIPVVSGCVHGGAGP